MVFYAILFDNIETVSDSDRHNAEIVVKNINGNIVENTQNHVLTLFFEPIPISHRNKLIQKSIFDIHIPSFETINLHGHTIELGYQHIVVEKPIYLNKDKFLAGQEGHLTIESKTKSYIVNYDNNKDLKRICQENY